MVACLGDHTYLSFMKNSLMLRLVFYGSAAFYVFVFALMAQSYAGNNPLNTLNNSIVHYVSLFPQGWAFFTKSPREPSLALYAVTNSHLDKIDLRGFESDYFFGISRKNRLIMMETGNVLKKLRDVPAMKTLEKTVLYRDNLNNYISPDTLTFNKVSRDEKNIVLRGKYLLVMEDFLPWSLLARQHTFRVKQHINIIPFVIE